jgi:ABC-type Mn2+/Zn2+ transport system permease subunit
MVGAVGVGATSGLVGLLISYHHDTAAGATMAMCAVIAFFAALVVRWARIHLAARHARVASA